MLAAILTLMKQGGRKVASSGFTMVEVLIVLAVSAVIFISAVALINGRQNRTEFTTSINNLQQQLQQIVNQTASGYFPNIGGLNCIGTQSPVKLMGGSADQGTSAGCIFLGKAVQFGLGSGSQSSQLGLVPLVGNQYKPSSYDAVLNLTQAKPRALYPADTGETAPTAAVETVLIGGKLSVAKSAGGAYLMSYKTLAGATVNAGAIAFVAGDPNGTLASGGATDSGIQQMSLYGVRNSAPNQDFSTIAKTIGNYNPSAPTNLIAASSASICMISGTTSESGLLTIDKSLHVTLKIFQDTTC